MQNSQETLKMRAVLQKLGLDEADAAVYLTLLTHPTASVADIATDTDVKRTSVYHTLERLKMRGLVSEDFSGLKKRYRPEPPARLKELLLEQTNILESALPDLDALYYKSATGGTSITNYKGRPAIKRAYLDLLSNCVPGDPYYVIGNQELWYNSDPEFFQSFIEKRSRSGVVTKLLFTDEPFAPLHKQYEKNWNQTIKILTKHITFDTDTVITPHSLLIHRLRAPEYALLINDPTVIEMQQRMFEVLWESC